MARFSNMASEFFRERGTTPVVISWRNHHTVDANAIEEAVTEGLEDKYYTVVVDSTSLHGDYWDGVLVELPNATAPARGSDSPDGEGVLASAARNIASEAADIGWRDMNMAVGGSACSSANLESVAESYFGFTKTIEETWE